MQLTTDDLRRGLAGRDVLAALALLLLVSGGTNVGVFVHAGTVLANGLAGYVPAVDGTAFGLVVLAGIYLQALVLAVVYRVFDGVRTTLRRRAERATSA